MQAYVFTIILCLHLATAQIFGNVGLVNGEWITDAAIGDFETLNPQVFTASLRNLRGEKNSTGALDFSCKQGGIPTAYCYSACVLGTTHARCGGDPFYCSTKGCQGNPECICATINITVQTLTLEDHFPYSIIPSNRTFTTQPAPDTVDGNMFGHSNTARTLTARVADLSEYVSNIDLEGHNLTLSVYPQDTSFEVNLRKRKYYKQWFFDGSWSGELPDELWITSDYMIVEIKVNGSIIDNRVFYLLAESHCKFTDCFWCFETIGYWSCFTWTQKVFVVAVMTVCFFIILAFFPALVWLLYWLLSSTWGVFWFFCKATWGFGKTPFGMVLSKYTDKVKRAKDAFVPIEEEQFKDDPVSEMARRVRVEEPVQQRRGVLKGPSRYSSTLIPLMMMVALASSVCTDGIFLTGSFQNCVKTSPTKESCSYVSQTLVSLSDVGATTCFSIKDPNTNVTVQSGQLNFTEEILVASTEFMYVTGQWALNQFSNYKCAERSSCPAECDPTYSSKTVPGPIGNNAPSAILLWPGEATCRRTGTSCALFGGSCSSCDDACVFSAYSIVPDLTSQTRYGNVYGFGALTRKPKVTWQTDGDQAITLNLGVTTTSGYLKITPQGSLNIEPTDFGTKKLIVSNNANAWLGFAAEVNSPVALGIGDIQSQTFSRYSTPSESAFIYPTSMVSIDERNTKDIYSTGRVGWSVLSSYPKLPTVVNGNTWSLVNGVFQSSVSSTSPLLVTISTDATFKIVRTLEAVCPAMTLLKSSGCNNCQLGISFRISAKSKCLSGLATVTFEPDSAVEIATKSILLTTTSKNFTINGFTALGKVVGSLCLIGTGGKSCVSIDFKTSSTSVLDPNDGNYTGNSTVIKDKGFNWGGLFTNFGHNFPQFFKDIFSGEGTAAMITVFVLGTGAVLAGSGIAIYYGWPYALKAAATFYPGVNMLLPTKLKVV